MPYVKYLCNVWTWIIQNNCLPRSNIWVTEFVFFRQNFRVKFLQKEFFVQIKSKRTLGSLYVSKQILLRINQLVHNFSSFICWILRKWIEKNHKILLVLRTGLYKQLFNHLFTVLWMLSKDLSYFFTNFVKTRHGLKFEIL